MSAGASSQRALGNQLFRRREYASALAAFDRAIALEPASAATLNNRGATLMALGDPARALDSYERALQAQLGFVEAHYNRAIALVALHRLDDALTAYDIAIAFRPDHAESYNNRGNVLRSLGRSLDALESYDKAIALRPSYVDAVENKAILLTEFGETEAARRLLEAVIRVEPRRARALYHLVRIRRMSPGDPELAALESLASESARLAKRDAIDVHFALGEAYDDIGDAERAFPHYAEGNALKRSTIAYDEGKTIALMRTIAEAFPAEVLRRDACVGSNAAPIFIFGMPRSGSTLIEQILSRHSRVAALGETEAFAAAVAGARNSQGRPARWPEEFADLSPDALRGVASRYLASVARLSGEAERTTDKLPSNFLYVGLVRLALPGARLIHARRDPIDTCWSCFAERFGDSGSLPSAYDLAELGRYYRAYDALMAHWRAALPEGAMLTVDYEDVVADIGGQTRRILDHCGLEWSEDCLEFQASERQVRTASALQVRQPLYSHSIGRWRRYERFLAPLERALSGAEAGV